MRKRGWRIVLGVLALVGVVTVVMFVGHLYEYFKKPKPGTVLDEAKEAGRTPESLPAADEDYYIDMDYGVTRDPEKVRAALDPWMPGISAADAVKAVVRGRNTWVVWTGGTDRLWDVLSRQSFGNIDFLKVVSNHPSLGYGRANRFAHLGLVNEPCFRNPSGPRQDRYGLWLDERAPGPGCPPADPFENETKYPGVAYLARGKNIPAGSYYGYGSGVIGLRLLPNPYFDKKAEAAWDAEKYYTDPDYYNREDLVKPYRVGMACGFCHVGPNPSNPPPDPENPTWAQLNSNPGAQWFWTDRTFFWPGTEQPDSFVYQLFHTYRPGTLDTSLISSDMINNPRTMNAFYAFGPRLTVARRWGKEKLAGGGLNNKQFNDFDSIPSGSPLRDFYRRPYAWTPRVLKDGADSAGGLGSLNRVFINVGLFSEEWLLHFIPFVGGPTISPIEIAVADKNSSYWKATESQTPDTALFFLAATPPDKLAAAPGGPSYMTSDETQLRRGKEVFAERCARCHSSKLPETAFTDFFPDDGCVGPNYLECWNDYWQWTKTEEFKEAARQIVLAPDFTADNYLSNELRIPVTLLETQACSPLATNAIADDIWDNFSSQAYKDLPAVGEILVHHPITGLRRKYQMPGGGRGYTRVPSLVSVWSTAPYFVNNALGAYGTYCGADSYAGGGSYGGAGSDGGAGTYGGAGTQGGAGAYATAGAYGGPGNAGDSGAYGGATKTGGYGSYGGSYPTWDAYDTSWGTSVADRVSAFESGITQLLWPAKRQGSRSYVTVSGRRHPGIIDLTTQPSYLTIAPGFLPPSLQRLSGFLDRFIPNVFGGGGVVLGPIPKGIPVNLLSNIDLKQKKEVIELVLKIKHDLDKLPRNANHQQQLLAFRNLVEPLLALSTCPDFVVNRGHYFGTDFLPATEDEPGLSDADKRALIEFLKTF